jgi:hypothetical protein
MTLARFLLVSVLFLAPAAVLAQPSGHSLEAVMIESASTPQQHMALANHYRAAASEARQQAQQHLDMAKRYGTAKMGAAQKPHCEKIAANLEDSAKQYDELAAGEEAAAKQ